MECTGRIHKAGGRRRGRGGPRQGGPLACMLAVMVCRSGSGSRRAGLGGTQSPERPDAPARLGHACTGVAGRSEWAADPTGETGAAARESRGNDAVSQRASHHAAPSPVGRGSHGGQEGNGVRWWRVDEAGEAPAGVAELDGGGPRAGWGHGALRHTAAPHARGCPLFLIAHRSAARLVLGGPCAPLAAVPAAAVRTNAAGCALSLCCALGFGAQQHGGSACTAVIMHQRGPGLRLAACGSRLAARGLTDGRPAAGGSAARGSGGRSGACALAAGWGPALGLGQRLPPRRLGVGQRPARQPSAALTRAAELSTARTRRAPSSAARRLGGSERSAPVPAPPPQPQPQLCMPPPPPPHGPPRPAPACSCAPLASPPRPTGLHQSHQSADGPCAHRPPVHVALLGRGPNPRPPPPPPLSASPAVSISSTCHHTYECQLASRSTRPDSLTPPVSRTLSLSPQRMSTNCTTQFVCPCRPCPSSPGPAEQVSLSAEQNPSTPIRQRNWYPALRGARAA